MFETMVLICLMGGSLCHTLQDTEGPYQTEKECVKRAYVIAMELPEYMPNYYAMKYKCITKGTKL